MKVSLALLALCATAATLVRGETQTIEIWEEALQPGGVVWNAALDKFLVSSLSRDDGRIWFVEDNAFHLPFVASTTVPEVRVAQTLAMHVDGDNLWYVQMNYTQWLASDFRGKTNSVSVVLADAATGANVAQFDLVSLVPERRQLPSGIATDAAGRAYVSEALQGRIVRLSPGGAREVYYEGAELQSPSAPAFERGATGIVVIDDGDAAGEYIVVANWATGALYKVPIGACFVPTEVHYRAPSARERSPSPLVRIIDMSYDATTRTLFAVGQNPDRIYTLRSDDHWRTFSVVEMDDTEWPTPTSITVRDHQPWVVFPFENEPARPTYPLQLYREARPPIEIPEPHEQCSPNGYLCEDLVNVHMDFDGSNVNNCLHKPVDRVKYFLRYDNDDAASK